MRAVVVGVALLAGAVVLASAPTARAQDSGYPSTGLAGGAAGAGVTLSYACGGPGTAVGASTYGYGGTPCSADSVRRSVSVDNGCDSRYTGASEPSSNRNWSYSPYGGTQSSQFYAAGGEAYSYAGYGSSYSPYISGAGANSAAGGDTTNGVADTVSLAACISRMRSPTTATPAVSGSGISLGNLASLPLPSTMGIQRGSDLRDPNFWLIQTREGSIVGRVDTDGRYSFFPSAQAASSATTAWRPWTAIDRPAVDHVWQDFAAWWTGQGRAWPPS